MAKRILIKDKAETELVRTGANCSLYISKPAMELLDRCSKKSRRSRSLLVSLFVERVGPVFEKNPAMFGV